jgi:hypothetical protein
MPGRSSDFVSDDFVERLRHGGTIAEGGFWMNRAFSPGALPQAGDEAAPLALNRYRLAQPPLQLSELIDHSILRLAVLHLKVPREP